MVLVAGQLLAAAQLDELAETDDARQAPHLERAIESRLDELERFDGSLPPPDVAEELVAAVVSLERLDRGRALYWARTILQALPSGPVGNVSVVARRVLARSGDRSVVGPALNEYFQAPDDWRGVLGDAAAATNDIRLRDFAGSAERDEEPSPELFRSRLARALGETMAPPRTPSLERLLEGDFLETQSAVLALPARSRYRAIRFLATRDHASLIGLPMTSETIDRLYPYLSISRHRKLRARSHRAHSARGRALASLLLSPRVDREEQRFHADAMPDAWLDAIAATGRDILTPIVGEAAVVRVIEAAAPHAAMVFVPSPEARVRLEQAATPEAIRWLGRRSDTVVSMSILAALRAEAEQDTRLAAEVELVRMGAPGAAAFVRSQLDRDFLEELLPAAVGSPVDVDLVQRAIERVGRRGGKQPAALVAMHRFHERYPREFLAWLDADNAQLRERAHFVMALSGDARRLPLLIELAVTGLNPSREAALRGLSETSLGNFDKRLHRLAGDSERSVRFQTAIALLPTGAEWAFRLLVAELNEEDPAERVRARRAVERLLPEIARARLRTLVSNTTASPFAVELYLDLDADRGDAAFRESLWRALAPYVEADDPTALLAAARLSLPAATDAVERYLDRR